MRCLLDQGLPEDKPIVSRGDDSASDLVIELDAFTRLKKVLGYCNAMKNPLIYCVWLLRPCSIRIGFG
jgi:hypothetical protein